MVVGGGDDDNDGGGGGDDGGLWSPYFLQRVSMFCFRLMEEQKWAVPRGGRKLYCCKTHQPEPSRRGRAKMFLILWGKLLLTFSPLHDYAVEMCINMYVHRLKRYCGIGLFLV